MTILAFFLFAGGLLPAQKPAAFEPSDSVFCPFPQPDSSCVGVDAVFDGGEFHLRCKYKCGSSPDVEVFDLSGKHLRTWTLNMVKMQGDSVVSVPLEANAMDKDGAYWTAVKDRNVRMFDEIGATVSQFRLRPVVCGGKPYFPAISHPFARRINGKLILPLNPSLPEAAEKARMAALGNPDKYYDIAGGRLYATDHPLFAVYDLKPVSECKPIGESDWLEPIACIGNREASFAAAGHVFPPMYWFSWCADSARIFYASGIDEKIYVFDYEGNKVGVFGERGKADSTGARLYRVSDEQYRIMPENIGISYEKLGLKQALLSTEYRLKHKAGSLVFRTYRPAFPRSEIMPMFENSASRNELAAKREFKPTYMQIYEGETLIFDGPIPHHHDRVLGVEKDTVWVTGRTVPEGCWIYKYKLTRREP